MFNANTYIRKKLVLKIGLIFYKAFQLIVLVGISYVMLQPILKQLSYALANPKDLDSGSFVWIPNNPTFTNFVNSQYFLDYSKHLWISIRVSAISTIIQLVISGLIGYGLARYRFKGNKLIFVLVIFTIIMPVHANVIPLFLDFRFFDFFGIGKLIGCFTGQVFTTNLLNTDWIYFLPAMFGVGLNSGLFIFIFRQFFMNMPKALEEAAWVDGCSPLATYVRIIIPNAIPVFVTVGLLSMVFYWNDSLIAGVLITSADFYSVVNRISSIAYDWNSGFNPNQFKVVLAALLLMAHAPLMIVFIFGQRFFIESMDRSGVKG